MSPEEKAEMQAKLADRQHAAEVQKALEDEIEANPLNIKVNGFDWLLIMFERKSYLRVNLL